MPIRKAKVEEPPRSATATRGREMSLREHVIATQALRDEFCAGFRRSCHGNLWCRWQGTSYTIYRRYDSYHFVIPDGSGRPRYSPPYITEEAALEGLLAAVFG